MASFAIEQLAFPFVPPAPPLPTELHNLKKNRSVVGHIFNTIRRGDKWANVPEGHEITLTEGPEHTVVGTARVYRVWKGLFISVPAAVLERNHSGAQTYGSVLQAMRNSYGEGFSESEEVVFLDYIRVS